MALHPKVMRCKSLGFGLQTCAVAIAVIASSGFVGAFCKTVQKGLMPKNTKVCPLWNGLGLVLVFEKMRVS